MIPAFVVTVEGRTDPLACSFVSVAQGQNTPVIRAQIPLLDPTDPITEDDLVNVKLGYMTGIHSDTFVGWDWIKKGHILDINRTARFGQRTLELDVDGSSSRFLRAPAPKDDLAVPEQFREYVARDKSFYEMLNDIYVAKLGFRSVHTNIPNFHLEYYQPQPAQSYHSTAAAFSGTFEPTYFHDATEDSLWLHDANMPISPNAPMRVITTREFKTLNERRERREIVNQLSMIVYTFTLNARGEEPGHIRPPTEREKLDDTVVTPTGYPRSQTWNRYEDFHDDHDDAGKVTYTRLKGQRINTFDDAGTLITSTIVENKYKNTTLDAGKVVNKYALVQLPGEEFDMVLVRAEEEKREWLFDDVLNQWQIKTEDTREEGFVILKDKVPLDEASKNGTVTIDPEEAMDWLPLNHSHTSEEKLDDQQVVRTTMKWDDLHGGVEIQQSESFIGATNLEQQRPTKTIFLEDAPSIITFTRRPLKSFDARELGEQIGRYVVQTHIFSHSRSVQYTQDIQMAQYDASLHNGELLAVYDPSGLAFYYVVLSVKHVVFADMTKRSVSALTCLRVPLAA